MRNGRKVEIPASFFVTGSSLTYEVSPGFQVTVRLAAVDIAATERANREAPGDFLKRATASVAQQKAPPTVLPDKTRAQRSITNRDLASYARARVESEVAYERRRLELGLPSVEETRLRNNAEAELIRQELEERRLEETESENYWRARASELRADVASTDAEIAFIRTRLDEVAAQLNSNSFTTVSPAYPFGFGAGRYSGFRGNRGVPNFGRSRAFSAPRSNTGFRAATAGAQIVLGQINPRFPLGGRFSGPLQGGYGPGGYRSQRFGGRRYYPIVPSYEPFQNATAYGSPYSYDLSYERSALITQLDELVGRRAGLLARWRELEEEARRAGAPPGWLRP
jgi:hypothetical protein